MSIHDEGLWAARLPNGDVRSGTLEQLHEAFRAGHLGEDTLVCDSRSDSWIKLADVLGAVPVAPVVAAPAAPVVAAPAAPVVAAPAPVVAAPAPIAVPRAPSAAPPAVAHPVSPRNGSSELWQVKLANGEVRSGTRQQLTEAVHAGHLDENVLVLAADATEWVRLGTVMGRTEPPARLVPSAQPPPPSVAPPVVAAPVVAAPVVAAPVVAAPVGAAPVVAAPVGAAPVGAPSRAPSAAPPDAELWQAKLPNGQVRSGTRKQLEEAVDAGHLDEQTLVLPAGATEWVTLASLVDNTPSEPGPEPVTVAEPAPVEAQPAAAAPLAQVEARPAATAPLAQETPSAIPQEEPAALAADAPPPVAEEASPPLAAANEPPRAQAASNGEPLWRVELTGKQLKRVFDLGLLDDDVRVLAAGADEWISLGDAMGASDQDPA